jgi:hypothetical protein
VDVRDRIETSLWEKAKWDIFGRAYFMKQWIPILSSWNVRQDDGSILQIVNRTNNTLECYNKRCKGLFKKQPTQIEFSPIIEIGDMIPGRTTSRYLGRKASRSTLINFIMSGLIFLVNSN